MRLRILGEKYERGNAGCAVASPPPCPPVCVQEALLGTSRHVVLEQLA
jgi:hypothetical protein